MSKSYSAFKALHKRFEEQHGEPADIVIEYIDGKRVQSREACGTFIECYAICHEFNFKLVTFTAVGQSDTSFIWSKNQYEQEAV